MFNLNISINQEPVLSLKNAYNHDDGNRSGLQK